MVEYFFSSNKTAHLVQSKSLNCWPKCRWVNSSGLVLTPLYSITLSVGLATHYLHTCSCSVSHLDSHHCGASLHHSYHRPSSHVCLMHSLIPAFPTKSPCLSSSHRTLHLAHICKPKHLSWSLFLPTAVHVLVYSCLVCFLRKLQFA